MTQCISKSARSLISTSGQNGNHFRIVAFLMAYSTNCLDTGDVKWGCIRNGQYPGKEQDNDSIFQHVALNLRINDGHCRLSHNLDSGNV